MATHEAAIIDLLDPKIRRQLAALVLEPKDTLPAENSRLNQFFAEINALIQLRNYEEALQQLERQVVELTTRYGAHPAITRIYGIALSLSRITVLPPDLKPRVNCILDATRPPTDFQKRPIAGDLYR